MFTKAYDTKATLRAMLFDLPSLEVVRIIEGAGGQKATSEAEEGPVN